MDTVEETEIEETQTHIEITEDRLIITTDGDIGQWTEEALPCSSSTPTITSKQIVLPHLTNSFRTIKLKKIEKS